MTRGGRGVQKVQSLSGLVPAPERLFHVRI